MVENSLGRLWVEGHPNEEIKANWKYYLEEAEQEPDVVVQLNKIREEYAKLNPADIKVIEKTLPTLIQTNETYESTQIDAFLSRNLKIDAFFESKPKIDAFLKIDANGRRKEYKKAS